MHGQYRRCSLPAPLVARSELNAITCSTRSTTAGGGGDDGDRDEDVARIVPPRVALPRLHVRAKAQERLASTMAYLAANKKSSSGTHGAPNVADSAKRTSPNPPVELDEAAVAVDDKSERETSSKRSGTEKDRLSTLLAANKSPPGSKAREREDLAHKLAEEQAEVERAREGRLEAKRTRGK